MRLIRTVMTISEGTKIPTRGLGYNVDETHYHLHNHVSGNMVHHVSTYGVGETQSNQ